ncbi:MAG: glycosyltransferase [Micromonosporaceae bacterium]|nr:glycosyltransferase [Micromonosporaceae bacterium]
MAPVLALQIVASVGLAAWLWLALLRGRFWWTDVRLPAVPEPAHWPSVAVVVPARNEAEILPRTVPTLLALRYPGPLQVIVVDDGSTDGTGPLVAERWPQVRLVSPGPVPPGWAGKLWALRAGVEAAGDVDLLLFTDADITHTPDSLSRLVALAEHRRLDLVSQMARLRCRTGWERLVVPAFVYFFAMLYPVRWVNRPGARTAAAAGGCVLLRRDALNRAGGLDAIRGAIIDDVALATAVKRSGGRVYLGLAGTVASVRPYPSLAALWHMVARSAYAQLRHNPLLLAGTTLGLAAVFLGPPVSTVVGLAGDRLLAGIGAAAWLVMTVTYVPMLRYYGQPALAALLLPFTATLYLGMTIDSARRHYAGRGAAWKGRTYSHRLPSP